MKVPIIITHEGAPKRPIIPTPGSEIFITGICREKKYQKIDLNKKIYQKIDPNKKVCTRCWGDPKPVSEFYKNRSRPDGLSVWCKECNNNWQRKYRKKPQT